MAHKEAELTIPITEQLRELARRRGYDTPAEYIRFLIETDAEALDQAYFWTDEWQAAERQVDKEIAAGDYEDFTTMDEFLADLISDDE